MKITMLQGYYEPEVASGMHMTTNLVEDLISKGHTVDIITPIPTRGVSDETRKKYKNNKLEKKRDGKLRIHRYWLPKEGKNTIIRAFRYLMGGVLHIIKSIKIETDIIVITSTPPTNGIIAAVLKKLKKVPIVYVLQDIFPDSMISAKMTKEGSIIWKIGRYIENITYRNTDRIIVISKDFKENLIKKGVDREKVDIVYNWVDESVVYPVKREENILFKSLGLNKEKFYVVYAGNLGNAQNIEVILEAAKATKQYDDIEFIIFGNGVQEDEYKQMARKMNLTNLSFYPLQPYDMVSYVYSIGNVSIVSCKEGFGGSALPSKTWSIMSTATPVLASFDENSELQNIIEENNIGLFTKAGDSQALKKAIVKLYKNRELCKVMGENSRQYIINNLSRKSQTKKYIEIIEHI